MFLWRPEGFWENNLSKLTPVPPELLKRDAELRKELATPDLRYLLVASGDSEDAVLASLERLDTRLEGAAHAGAIGSFEHAAQFLPSAALQRKRQARVAGVDATRAHADARGGGLALRSRCLRTLPAPTSNARAVCGR